MKELVIGPKSFSQKLNVVKNMYVPTCNICKELLKM